MALNSKSLERYEKKRDFSITSEPAPTRPRRATGHSFVIQKHAARRLHYDFRLELDGVLKSWAVTKGPSLDPADRRLAVHVEDHPLAYGSFEGIIPEGQYGGGTVMLWDKGSWEPEGDAAADYARGKLKFALHGERLRGRWMLVRMGGRARDEKHDNWLLIKERDEFARPGEGDALLERAMRSVASKRTMEEIATARRVKTWNSNKSQAGKPGNGATAARRPQKPKTGVARHSIDVAKIEGVRREKLETFIAPQLGTLATQPPEGEAWIHEIKIDGYRIYARCQNGVVHLMTRRGQDWTDRFESIAAAVAALPARQFALDGEVAILDKDGRSNFGALQEALSAGRGGRFHYVVFDLLHLDGYDLRKARLGDRKAALRELLADAPRSIIFSDDIRGEGAAVFAQACRMGLEGIVSKRAERPYESGRSAAWLKTKCVQRQEFVIGGFTDPKTARGGIGALAIGYFEGRDFHYAGRVGTGFSQTVSLALAKQLRGLMQSSTPFIDVPREMARGVHWVKPVLVCEVEFSAWTRDGVLRQPSFQGLREDKPATAVKREEPVQPGGRPKASASARSRAPALKSGGDDQVAGVTITHPDRVVFPEDGITKLELAQYYEAVAPFILPHLTGRPLSLLRCPQGLSARCFFQKHFATGVKELPRIAIKENHGTADYVMIRDTRDLIRLIQEGIVEIHPWGAEGDDPEKPDQLIFDLDPAPELPFATVIDTAIALRGHLESIGLTSFVKTTGGKGLHVVVPLRRGIEWKALKEFAAAIGKNFVAAAPSQFTVNPRKDRRANKIFIDYLRNDRGSTAVAPYVARARPGAPVAMPVEWSALGPKLRPEDFTVETVPDQLRRRKRDPWRDMSKHRQAITAAMRRAVGLPA